MMKRRMTLDEIERLLIDDKEDMKVEPDMKGITMMLYNAIAPAFAKQRIKLEIKVKTYESSSGIEYERAQFQTQTNLDKDILEKSISNLPGCNNIFHFLYDGDTGKGQFISLCSVPVSGEYEITYR